MGLLLPWQHFSLLPLPPVSFLEMAKPLCWNSIKSLNKRCSHGEIPGMENFLLPSPRVWQNYKQMKNRVLRWEESGKAMYFGGMSSSLYTFSFNLVYTTHNPEGHSWCAPLCAARGKRPCKQQQQQHWGLTFLQLPKEGGLSAPGKRRPGGIEEGCTDTGGTASALLALCVMLRWPTFNSNWCSWQMERALSLWRHRRVCRGPELAAPGGRRQRPGTPSVISSWALNEVRQDTDKWPCLVNTAVISAVITRQMGTWRNLNPCPHQSWRASGSRSCGGDYVCSYHLRSPAKQLSVCFVTKGTL